MKLRVSIKEVNHSYSKEYADQYHFGEESNNNMKVHWERSYELEDFDALMIRENTSYFKAGTLTNGKEHSATFKNMFVLDAYYQEKVVATWGISSGLIENTHKILKKKRDITYFYIYVNDKNAIMMSGTILVLEEDVPEEFFVK